MNLPDTTLPKSMDGRFVVLIGLMGAGKTNLGQRIASATGLPFIDTDSEIEKSAGYTIEEIFERFGEKEFRDGERRVIARLLQGEPAVMATGGGSFMDPGTRRLIRQRGISIWLRADLELLHNRTKRRNHRPLIKNDNPKATLTRLIKERYPDYGEADIIFDVSDEPASETAKKLLATLLAYGSNNQYTAPTG